MPRLRPPLALALGLVLFLLGVGAARADVKYATEITGVEDKKLRDQLKAISQLVALEERLPASVAALRRRAEDDIGRLKQALESEGYWAAKLNLVLVTEAEPVRVTVEIDPGPRYTLETVTFVDKQGGTPPVLDRYHPIAFGLELGEPARAAAVIAAETRIAATMGHFGYPFAKVTDRKVVVDHATRTMAVTYTADPGPQARFGPHRIEGLTRLDRGYVERRIGWREGDIYDGRLVEETRKALVDSGLFTAVRINPAKELDAKGEVPMTVAVTERLPRSIGAGIVYNTSEGFGTRAFWEHRNVLGGGEKLRASAEVAQQQLGLNGTFRIPDVLGLDQDLLFSATLADETPEAYNSRRLRLFSGFEKRFGARYIAGAGLSFEKAYVTDPLSQQTYSLMGLPLYVRRDTTDDLLNPTIGGRQSLTTTPYQSVGGTNDLAFVSSRLTGSAYRALDHANRYIAAGYGAIGTIFGEGRDVIPADKRLYVGGGGSVRGYGYQRAGPLGPDDRPLGGRSSLELGTELRVKVTETIGVVPFVEAGNAYAGVWPGGRLLVGTGIGMRYYTAVGPVRFDLAFPLERRSGDAFFQVYISLGQAF
jgi:translocation and assembly module TamA